MADQIKKSDLFEDGLFSDVAKDADAFLKVVKEVKVGLTDLMQATRDKIIVANPKDFESIKELNKDIEKSIDLNDKLNKSKIIEERLNQQVIKTIEKERKELTASAKEAEKKNKVIERQSSAYSQLSASLNENRKIAKDLLASKKELTAEDKKFIESVQEQDSKLKQIDATLGQFNRNVGDYKGQLRELQIELSKLEPGTEEFNKAAVKAGELRDKINDSKDAVKAFSTESKATTAKTLFGQILGDLKNLDFKGAAEKSRQFASVVSQISFKEVIGGIKNFGSALLNIGKALLANPFVLVTVGVVALGKALYDTFKAFQAIDESALKFNEDIKEVYKTLAQGEEELAKLRRQTDVLTGKLTESEAKVADIRADEHSKFNDIYDEKQKAIKAVIDRLKEQSEFSTSEKLLGSTGLIINLEKVKKATNEADREIAEINKVFGELELNNARISFEKQLQVNIEGNKKIEDETKKSGERKAKIKKEINKGILEQEENLIDTLKQLEIDNIKDNRLREEAQLIFNVNRQIKDIENSKANAEQKADIIREINIKLAKDLEDIANKFKPKKLVGVLDDEDFKIRQEQIAKELEERKEFANKLLNLIEEEVNRENEIRRQAIDDRIKDRESEIERQDRLAEKGLENQKVFSEEQLAKEELAKERQQKREIAQQKALAFIRLVSSYAQTNAKDAVPLAIRDIALAELVSAAFATGGENIKGEGTGTSDSILARISKGESVITARATNEHAGLPTAMNEGKVDEYFAQTYLPLIAAKQNMGATASNMHSSMMLHQLVNVNDRLQSLEKAIVNKKEQNVQWDKHGNLVISEVESGIKRTVKHLKRKPRL